MSRETWAQMRARLEDPRTRLSCKCHVTLLISELDRIFARLDAAERVVKELVDSEGDELAEAMNAYAVLVKEQG